MSLSEFERLVEALIPAHGRVTLTLTDTPSSAPTMMRLLERSIVIGNRRGAPLAEIHMPIANYQNLDHRFWHVPIEDSSAEGVVRLVFERPDLEEMHTADAA